LMTLVQSAWEGLKTGNSPVLCEIGVGGTYFMHDPSNNVVGVFKPQDEEPFNINNPKGFMPRRGSDAGLKEGILVGEASVRECAAFVLDYDNFSGVPPTDLVLCQHPVFHSNPIPLEDSEQATPSPQPHRLKSKIKVGSFQQYREHDGDTEEQPRSLISKFPVGEVHKIALLDVRLFNTDRHGGNVLYKEWTDMFKNKTYELIPIDHGYTMPSTLDEAWFEWQSWPQAKQKMEPRTKEYIHSLDAEMDIKLLKRKFTDTFRSEHFRILRISTMLLKKAARWDLTFYDIACLMCRSQPKLPSKLETLCQEAAMSLEDKADEETFQKNLSTLLEAEMQRISVNSNNPDLRRKSVVEWSKTKLPN